MQVEDVISVTNLSKRYKLYSAPIDRLKESFDPFRRSYHRDFFALDGVSFSIPRGTSLGILGKNGSGKSTLLKIVTGVLTPSAGEVRVNGRVSAILELGSGFNPELTGRENLFFQGAILGFTKTEMDTKLPGILSFADIGSFVDQPVKTYSSGMLMRLAFSLAISIEPDILIIDEALSVGDVRFRLKCFQKIQEFREKGATFLFVSHSIGEVMQLCQSAIWLDQGKVIASGDAKKVAEQYHAWMVHGADSRSNEDRPTSESESRSRRIPPMPPSATITGEGGIDILGVGLTDATGELLTVIKGPQPVKLVVEFRTLVQINTPLVAFQIINRQGIRVLGSNSYVLEKELAPINLGAVVRASFCFDLPELENGEYLLAIGVGDGTQDTHVRLIFVPDAQVVQMLSTGIKQKQAVLVKLEGCTLDCGVLGDPEMI